ncbi:hypothetical protein DASC09_046710 [Saccharomycopsis crataegensis]|uniref:GATA-type domain-containing protein n=1 Tax=Saccharomycopsis crataegensis TaxID=43959 RepID=A0AAV5QRI0_9ASCO|nr:hypothetical protein DASC09_046710 [Saccharomycopsis crataegensis]
MPRAISKVTSSELEIFCTFLDKLHAHQDSKISSETPTSAPPKYNHIEKSENAPFVKWGSVIQKRREKEKDDDDDDFPCTFHDPLPESIDYFSLNNSTDLFNKIKHCAICLIQETPQWRTFPRIPGNVCNACGAFYTKLSNIVGEVGSLVIMCHLKNAGLCNYRDLNGVLKVLSKGEILIPTLDQKLGILTRQRKNRSINRKSIRNQKINN